MNSSKHCSLSSKPLPSIERGIALLSVLWIVLLVSILAASTAFMARTQARIVNRDLSMARGDAVADAVIVHILTLLADEQTSRHPPVGGIPINWQFDQLSAAIAIYNEDGRIDINHADDMLILAYLHSQNVDESQSRTLLDTLRDWQDIDDISRTQGAERSDYQGLGLAVFPRNAPLETIDELRRIPAWHAMPQLDCWLDDFTIYTSSTGVNAADATPGVLNALQWAQSNGLGNRDWLPANANAHSFSDTRSLIGEALRIQVTVKVNNDVTLHKEWVGRITGDHQNPTLTYRWTQYLDSCTKSSTQSW